MNSDFQNALRDAVFMETATYCGCELEEVKDSAFIEKDLGGDSLTCVEIAMAVESRFRKHGLKFSDKNVGADITVEGLLASASLG